MARSSHSDFFYMHPEIENRIVYSSANQCQLVKVQCPCGHCISVPGRTAKSRCKHATFNTDKSDSDDEMYVLVGIRKAKSMHFSPDSNRQGYCTCASGLHQADCAEVPWVYQKTAKSYRAHSNHDSRAYMCTSPLSKKAGQKNNTAKS